MISVDSDERFPHQTPVYLHNKVFDILFVSDSITAQRYWAARTFIQSKSYIRRFICLPYILQDCPSCDLMLIKGFNFGVVCICCSDSSAQLKWVYVMDSVQRSVLLGTPHVEHRCRSILAGVSWNNLSNFVSQNWSKVTILKDHNILHKEIFNSGKSFITINYWPLLGRLRYKYHLTFRM